MPALLNTTMVSMFACNVHSELTPVLLKQELPIHAQQLSQQLPMLMAPSPAHVSTQRT
jgi:hypothetical protein